MGIAMIILAIVGTCFANYSRIDMEETSSAEGISDMHHLCEFLQQQLQTAQASSVQISNTGNSVKINYAPTSVAPNPGCGSTATYETVGHFKFMKNTGILYWKEPGACSSYAELTHNLTHGNGFTVSPGTITNQAGTNLKTFDITVQRNTTGFMRGSKRVDTMRVLVIPRN